MTASVMNPNTGWTELASGYNLLLGYGDGSDVASQHVGTIDVTFGQVTLPEQIVSIVDPLSTADLATWDSALNGVVGLGFKSTSGMRAPDKSIPPALLDTLTSVLEQPVFTVDAKAFGQAPGMVTFGSTGGAVGAVYAPLAQAQGDLVYWAVDSTNVQAILADTTPITLASGPIMIDSGTSLIYLDELTVNQTYKQPAMNGQAIRVGGTMPYWKFPCGMHLPDFSIGVSDGISTVQVPINMAYSYDTSDDPSYCVGSIQSRPGIYVLGIKFYEKAIVIHDATPGQVRIGIAPKS